MSAWITGGHRVALLRSNDMKPMKNYPRWEAYVRTTDDNGTTIEKCIGWSVMEWHTMNKVEDYLGGFPRFVLVNNQHESRKTYEVMRDGVIVPNLLVVVDYYERASNASV
jgi:hypothetical protein